MGCSSLYSETQQCYEKLLISATPCRAAVFIEKKYIHIKDALKPFANQDGIKIAECL